MDCTLEDMCVVSRATTMLAESAIIVQRRKNTFLSMIAMITKCGDGEFSSDRWVHITMTMHSSHNNAQNLRAMQSQTSIEGACSCPTGRHSLYHICCNLDLLSSTRKSSYCSLVHGYDLANMLHDHNILKFSCENQIGVSIIYMKLI